MSSTISKLSKYKGRPWTKQEYIKKIIDHKIILFNTGNNKIENTDLEIILKNKEQIVFRSKSIEHLRITLMRALNKKIGASNYKLIVVVFPHHFIRRHKTTNIDKISMGMRRAFGKVIERGAFIKPDKNIIKILSFKKYKQDITAILKNTYSNIPFKKYLSIIEK